jgi:amidase
MWSTRARTPLRSDELDEYVILSEEVFDTLDVFESESVADQSVAEGRDAGRRPAPDEDPTNSVITWCDVKPTATGPLSGLRIGLKDNIAVAGVPLTAGSRVLEGYVPRRDATVVKRLLAEGAEIRAKTNMDAFGWSGGGETSDFGVIRNPHDPTRTAGGSSGGSAAILYSDAIDISFGTDQGGSVRIPASWCGVLGHKPTFGLVPYTGILSIDASYDHVGPLAREVKHLALALDATAGWDEGDSRQRALPKPATTYEESVAYAPDDLRGVRLGVLEEGFVAPDSNARPGTTETEEEFRSVVRRLCELGAEVVDVSVPTHRTAPALALPGVMEGQVATVLGHGNGYHWLGRYSEDLPEFVDAVWEERSGLIPEAMKVALILGTYLREAFAGVYYARSQNFRPVLRREYDRALGAVDYLIMPTTPHFAQEHIEGASISEKVIRGWGQIANTFPSDMTGHPALSMPAGFASGLPVGVMLVGRHFADSAMIALARTYEAAFGWARSSGEARRAADEASSDSPR